jgi:ergothioneine biosynthesis protein EgtB
MTVNPEKRSKSTFLRQFRDLRTQTLELVKTLERDDFVVQVAQYTSPIKWHMGHVSWIYETILNKLDESYEFYSKEFSEYLNSYYQQFGIPNDKNSRGAISRPTTEQIFQYFDIISQRVETFIESEHGGDAVRLISIGFNHEYQHQELLTYDLKHLLAEHYVPTIKKEKPKSTNVKQKSVRINGGIYIMGYNGTDYCYDIELPEHKVYIDDYMIDAFPITNQQYQEFMDDGGYDTYRYWLADGWAKVKENGWKSPMYWEKVDNYWIARDFLGVRKLNPNEPVCHVSYYEADAYCKWAEKRLPTEAEWEKAACWNEEKQQKTVFPWGNEQPTEQNCNLLESHYWGCTEIGSYPQGMSPLGCHQMIGDVWEWTSSEFTGYPRFKTQFEEYNDKWFTNQKILRGGSFGTPKASIRGSYRNFFRLDERWLFAGFRCVEKN